MSEFKQYKRKAIAELRHVTEAECNGAGFASNISVSVADADNGSPKQGDMIARNPENHNDQWLVAADYFAVNFEQLSQTLKSTEMSFGEALTAIQNGLKVARHGWNGKGMYLVYFSPLEHGFADTFEIRGEMKPLLPFIIMKTADDMYIPWLASQSDMLSNDWEIL